MGISLVKGLPNNSVIFDSGKAKAQIQCDKFGIGKIVKIYSTPFLKTTFPYGDLVLENENGQLLLVINNGNKISNGEWWSISPYKIHEKYFFKINKKIKDANHEEPYRIQMGEPYKGPIF